MRTSTTGWSTLSAYVDGELDPADAAAVADAVRCRPELAEQVAILSQLKAATHAARPIPPERHSVLPRKQPWGRAMAVAALLTITCGLAVLSTTSPTVDTVLASGRDTSSPAAADLLATARDLHGGWLEAEAIGETRSPAAVLLSALADFGQVPLVPDLASTELEIGYVATVDRSGGRILQVGYRGRHGCRLSLFMRRSAMEVDVGPAPAGERFQAWHAGELDYLLFAQGMDPDRFRLIADVVEKATRMRMPLDRDSRQRLAANKRVSAHCSA